MGMWMSLTRFVNERTVVTVIEKDPLDVNYQPLQENKKQIRINDFRDRGGIADSRFCRCLRQFIMRDSDFLPAMPISISGMELWYLVPVFDDPQDQVACKILQELFNNSKSCSFPDNRSNLGLGSLTLYHPAATELGLFPLLITPNFTLS